MLNPNKDKRPTSRDYLKSLVSFKKSTNSTKYLNCIFFHFKVSIGKTDEIQAQNKINRSIYKLFKIMLKIINI
jgi:hypothetical protein